MQALVLAGGLGTRLRDVVSDRPKSMAPVNGKPFLEYQIRFLKNSGIDDIVLSTGYLGEKIEEYFGSGKDNGVSIRYIKEKELLGTGGAVKHSLSALEEQFLVLNGDSIFLIDVNSMIEFHKSNDADLTLALATVANKSRFGNVLINDKFRVMEFSEKQNTDGNLISGGIYLFKKNSFNWESFPEKFSIEKEFFPTVVGNSKMFGFVSDSYFIDIGTVEDYTRFSEHLNVGTIKL